MFSGNPEHADGNSRRDNGSVTSDVKVCQQDMAAMLLELSRSDGEIRVSPISPRYIGSKARIGGRLPLKRSTSTVVS
ncbi:hypothetical protein UP10_13095 [Bradyrhizobium sp. LTSPM299]|nr:hypothetical protein UP10_13095 [Bradyrhizobium sp. LTSPM299]